MKCQQQLSVRSSAGVLEAPSGYALRCLQDIKAKRTVYLLRNRTILFATNTQLSREKTLFRVSLKMHTIRQSGTAPCKRKKRSMKY